MFHLPQYFIPEELKQVLGDEIIKSEKSQVYARVLDKLKEAKSIDLAENHYLQLLKIALYLEEYQCEIDIRKYDLQKKRIFKVHSKLFSIETTDDDEIPMIRPSDLIDIIDTTDNKCYSLRIVKVNERSIQVRPDSWFSDAYSVTKLYNIEFKYQNYPLRCNHYALWLTYYRNVLTSLFPKISQQSMKFTTINYSTQMKFFDSSVKSNREQAQAVLSILHKSSFPHPYILYGPPGTGKTATIVESIYQIIEKNTRNRVLVCTPSNTAADELTKRLLGCVKSGLVFRMYSRTKDPLTIDQKILPYCNCQKIEEKYEIIAVKREDIAKKRVIVTTLCNSIKLILMGLECDYFSHVIIDEVGQSIEPDILIPISLVSWNGNLYSQIVLAGDPKQLGPTVMSELAAVVLGRSVLDRLMSYPIYQKMSNGKFNSKYITELLINYRNHPEIIRISNELFYNNELITQPAFKHDEFHVIFCAVFGKEERSSQPHSTSSRNRKEVSSVLGLIDHLIKNKQAWGLDSFQEDIGVVTPFKLQSKEIKKVLISRNLKNINVGTVELFQGQERKIIIISTVRSKVFSHGDNLHIGSLSNPKRFNVAVTRAKSKLIVIGNPNALKVDPYWGYLIKYCIDNQSYYGDPSRSNLLDNAALNRTVDHSEVINSRSLIKWRPFKIFKLDDKDTDKKVEETTRLILNTTMKSVPNRRPSCPTQSKSVMESAWSKNLIINPSTPTQCTSVEEIKTESIPIKNIESARSSEHKNPAITTQFTSVAEIKIRPIETIPPTVPPVQSTFVSKIDLAVNPCQSTPIQTTDPIVPKKKKNSYCTIL